MSYKKTIISLYGFHFYYVDTIQPKMKIEQQNRHIYTHTNNVQNTTFRIYFIRITYIFIKCYIYIYAIVRCLNVVRSLNI